MIQANELRIGNKTSNGDVVSIFEDHFYTKVVDTTYNSKYSKAKPIPLTEEILLKCGFKPRNEHRGIGAIYDLNISDDWKFNKSVGFIHDKDNKDDIYLHFLQHPTAYKIKYLHQLQNLYFALTNTELEINL